MTQEETPSPKDRVGTTAVESGKSKRKIVVSHMPLKGGHTEQAHSSFDEEALLHPSAASTTPSEPTFRHLELPPSPDLETPSNHASRNGLAIFLSFSALIGVGILGYFGAELYSQLSGIQAIQAEADRQAALLSLVQTELSTEKQGVAALKTEQAEKLTNFEAELKSTQDRVLQALGRTDEGWLLAEVQYLLRIANERLTVLQDVDTAIYQLNAADDRLKQLSNPAFLTVREAIAKDVERLKSLERPDRDELTHRLGQLERAMIALPLVKPKLSDPSSPMSVSFEPGTPGWKRGLEHAWQEIKGLIRVRHYEGAISLPILSETDAAILQRAIQLQMTEARLAVWQGHAALYQESLKRLSTWLGLYFEASSARSQIEAEIDTLSRTTITWQVPDLALTLNTLSAAQGVN